MKGLPPRRRADATDRPEPNRRICDAARVIVLLSTSDTDLLSARASGADYWLANPSRPNGGPEHTEFADTAFCVFFVGKRQELGFAWCSLFTRKHDRDAIFDALCA